MHIVYSTPYFHISGVKFQLIFGAHLDTLLLDQVALVVTWRPGMLRPLEESVSGETRIDSLADITSLWNWLPCDHTLSYVSISIT